MVLLRSVGFLAAKPELERRKRSLKASSDAFEPSCVLRGIVNGVGYVAGRVEKGDGLSIINDIVRPTWNAIEPIDLLVVVLLWELARDNGIVTWINRWTGRYGKMHGNSRSSQLRREIRLGWALWLPVRHLLCRIFPLFYIFDVGCTAIRGVFPLPKWLQPSIAILGYGIFFCDLIRNIKRVALARYFLHLHRTPDLHRGQQNILNDPFIAWKNRVDTVDRIGDAFVYAISFAIILELLALEIGFRLTSLLAFGGIGSLVIGLACQTPLSNIVAGIILAISNAFSIDDDVQIGAQADDAISGYVYKLGWYSTHIRGYDNKISSIPNSKIAGEIIINFSRAQHKQFTSSITLRRDDFQRLSSFLPHLRKNLATLPHVIDDRIAHRTLRVNLARFTDSGEPQIDIELHLATNDDDVFFEIREKIYNAIQHSLIATNTALYSPTYDIALQPDLPQFYFHQFGRRFLYSIANFGHNAIPMRDHDNEKT